MDYVNTLSIDKNINHWIDPDTTFDNNEYTALEADILPTEEKL